MGPLSIHRLFSQQLDPVAQGYPPCLRAIMATALLVKTTGKIHVESSLTIFVPHAVEAFTNFYHTQHFSVSCLTFYEVFMLTSPHITLLCCNNLNPATLLPSITHEVTHDCLITS